MILFIQKEKPWKIAHTYWDGIHGTVVFNTRVIRIDDLGDLHRSLGQMLRESLNSLLLYFDLLLEDGSDGDKELMRSFYRAIWNEGMSPLVVIERARKDLRTFARRCGDPGFIDACHWMSQAMDEVEPYFE